MTKKIDIKAGKPYRVKIGKGLLDKAGEEAKALGLDGKALIISDDNVAALYLEKVSSSLKEAGFEVFSFVIPHGESSKSAENLLAILEFAAENAFSRTDTFFALGGGVVGDLCGFAAAVYMRGTNFVQLPTTLLAAVDSSVGGKTAIDLEAGKNLAGAFYQPKLVLCDTATFDTLPDEEFSNGMAEVIKYGMFCDGGFLDILTESNTDIEEIVARCVAIKARVVEADEFDKGERMFLNFGHTVAHAVENLSGYTTPHGSAVAIGMAAITKAAIALGKCESKTFDILVELLKKYRLPFECPYGIDEVYNVTLKDKKNAHGKITLVIPAGKGESVLQKCDYDELKDIITLGLK
ncbi:MAG: 3-dehydroquinate synthase [Clostridia bacterium]|nr:3-dehydroquinate synthase [Clostridia bacterium]